ncbi:MAG: type II toxin-antitoxin system RelE/ParE family toxin [Acidobacteria bacterium]|nr:type II toxin-antitoxin system RelE/ParE family toxin [Acidobacteriota bacterium]
MKKKYQVAWAETAQYDLKQVIDYIAIDSFGNASRILQKIKKKVSALYTMPDRGRIVPELKEQGIHTYRELIIAPWRVIFRISDTTVFVLSVIDSRRNVEDILLDRLTK